MSKETSASLRRNIPKILTIWGEEAYKRILSSAGVTSLVLKNAMNTFLEQVASALDGANIDATSLNIAKFAKTHGGSREPLHYSLAEVILEFQILQRVILEVLEEDNPISEPDRKIIIGTIDQALSVSATQFAQALNEGQEQFALTLVHDLRNPINAAKLGALLIKKDTTASNQSLLIAGKIDKNMDRLESMLKELLDVSRIRAGMGMGAFEMEPIRLDLLASEVAQEMKDIHGDRFEIHSEAVVGEWNKAGLRRVFENLMVNAVKYGGSGPVKVFITQDDSNGFIRVHNDGNPIPPDQQSMLFKRFLRGSTKSQTGWGLGLALVAGMVEAHSGTVRVESSASTGTDFIVQLPKEEAKVAKAIEI